MRRISRFSWSPLRTRSRRRPRLGSALRPRYSTIVARVSLSFAAGCSSGGGGWQSRRGQYWTTESRTAPRKAIPIALANLMFRTARKWSAPRRRIARIRLRAWTSRSRFPIAGLLTQRRCLLELGSGSALLALNRGHLPTDAKCAILSPSPEPDLANRKTSTKPEKLT